jgi:hypothetical protein
MPDGELRQALLCVFDLGFEANGERERRSEKERRSISSDTPSSTSRTFAP